MMSILMKYIVYLKFLFQGLKSVAGMGSPVSSLPAEYLLNKPQLILCQLRAAKTTLYFILSGYDFYLDHISV